MANNITVSSTSYNGRYLYVYCTQTINEESNSSTINWTLYSTGGNKNYYDVGWTEVKINGTQVYYSDRVAWDDYSFPAAKGSTSGKLTVNHNTYGEAKITVDLSTAIYTYTRRESSATWELDNVPRAARILSAPDFNDEETSLTITYTNPLGEEIDALEACIADGSTVVVPYRAISKTGTSYTFELTEAEIELLRKNASNAASKTLNFYVRTIISGKIYWSYIGKTFTVINANPIIKPVVFDIGSNSTTLTGNPFTMIKYFNTMQASLEATGVKEATINRYFVKCGNDYVEAASNNFVNAASNQFNFTAIDSRGNETSEEIVVPMVEYVPLTCELEADLKLVDDGAVIAFTLSGDYFTGSFGAVDNELLVSYTVDGNTYELEVPEGAIEGNKYEITADTVPLDYSKSQTLVVEVKDKINTLTKTSKAFKAVPVFDWGENDFKFNVPVYMGDIELDYIIEQGENDGWTYRKWKSGKAECWITIEHSTAISKGWGSMYVGSNLMARKSYPFGFKEKPVEIASLQNNYNAAWLFAESTGNGVNSA